MNKILIIAAHPDDEVLGVGGLLARLAEKKTKIRLLFLGEGSSCRFETGNNGEIKKAIKSRQDAAKKVAEMFLIDEVYFEALKCGKFDRYSKLIINKIIEKHLQTFQPDAVFTHSATDLNNDHKITNHCSLMAARPSVSKGLKFIYSYEILSSSECNLEEPFMPNSFLELAENEVEKKWQALSFYQSEISDFPFPRSRLGIFTQAQSRGMQIGSEYAEAYRLLRGII